MPFNPQQGMIMPGMQGARPGQFPMQGQQGGRGAPNSAQSFPPNAYGIPASQMPFMQQGAFPPNLAQFNQMAQVQAAQFGRGAGGRGAPNMQGMPGIPPQMMQGQRGRDGRPQPYPPQSGRGMNMNVQQAQMGGFPQGRGVPQQMTQGPMAIPSAAQLQQIMAAAPEQQKQLLGEALFPKIASLQPNIAGKITGMLLDMDNAEIIQLLLICYRSIA